MGAVAKDIFKMFNLNADDDKLYNHVIAHR